MSASDRSSTRAVEFSENTLASGPVGAISGADDRGQLALHHARPGTSVRTSRHQLALIKSRLSDRQLSILQSLNSLKFASAKNLERLLYPTDAGHFTKLSAARSSRRDLAHLFDTGLIDRLDRRVGGVRAGSASYVYALSPIGARVLGEENRRRSREPSLAHLDHVLAVTNLVVRLHEHSRTGAIEVVDVQTEPACWRPLIAAHGGRATLKPDLRVVLATGDQELHWFVEIDRATEHRPVLTRKFQAYLAAWQQGREQAEHGIFPRVLWVVPDQGRADVISSVLHTLGTAPAGMFVVCVTDQAVEVLSGTEGGAS